MTQNLSDAAPSAARPSAAPGFPAAGPALIAAAHALLPSLEAGRPVDAAALRHAMTDAFGGTDAQGVWDWKTAYDACEAAVILFLRKYGRTILARSPASSLALIERSLERATALLGTRPALWLHGGGAEALRERLPPHRWVPDAVLRGLAHWQAHAFA